jgi:xanthine dehydrogenase accessory factor
LKGLQESRPFALATIVKGEAAAVGQRALLRPDGTMLSELSDKLLLGVLQEQAASFFQHEQAQVITAGASEIFVESIFPAPKLIIVGAVHVAIPLASMAKMLDYQVILIDPRGAFASGERFPHVDRLVRKWPEEALQESGLDAGACLVILTHDAKLDDPALKYALQHQPGYIGILGSTRTHEKRIKRLQEEGFSDEQLARVHAPVGLEIGASTPAEIALSIMAEIVAQRRSSSA